MSFSDKDKRIIVEVVNHIQHAYSSDQAFKQSESISITLPCRLVLLTAETLGQTYRPGILSGLEESELELLLTSLLKSVNAMQTSLKTVIKALPEKLPSGMIDRLNQQVDGFEAMQSEPQNLSAVRLLIESEKKMLAEKQELDELRERQQHLLDAQEALRDVDLDEVRSEVARLDAVVGPSAAELEELQRAVAERTADLESLTAATSEAEEIVSSNDARARDQLEKMLDVSSNLIAAMNPYLSKCESRIREAVDTIATEVSEGRRLKAELQARISEVSEVLEETARLAAVLSLYTQSNRRVVRSVPTVINVTKEKLSRVEDQLHEIDVDLKRALEQHQNARHVAEVAKV